jgi:hypothetical protein
MKFVNPITTTRLILLIIIIITSIFSLTILLWDIFTHPFETVEGQGLVDTEINILIFNMKPITLLVISSFILWMSGLEFLHNFLLKSPKIFKILMIFLLASISMIYVYETIWNFFIWNTAYELNKGNVHIDNITPQLNQMNPTRIQPKFRTYNLVYITKRDALYVACSLYGMFFFYALMNNDTHKKLEE